MIDTEALRKKVIDLAIQGKLTQQLPKDGNAEDLYAQIQEEKTKLIKEEKIKKENPLPPITEDEIPFEIPNNWKWVCLGELCTQITDGTHKTPTYQDEGIPFLSVKNISSGSFDLKDVKYISEEEHAELVRRCNPKKGDVLVCRIGTLGKAITIDFDMEFSIFVSLGLIKTTNTILSDYIVQVINSGYGDAWVMANKAGGAMHTYKINLNSLSLLSVPFPPLAEQKRIVEKIKEVLAQIDIIDTLQQQYESDREILKGKIIDAGICGKLTEQLPEDGDAEELYAQIQEEKAKLIKDGKIKKEKPLPPISEDEIPFEIPSNWKWCRLQELVYILGDGIHGTPHYDQCGEYYFINGNNLSEGKIVLKASTKKIGEDEYLKYKKDLNESTILVSINGTIGNLAYYNNERIILGKSACYFNLLDRRMKEFVFFVLKSDYFLKYAHFSATGVTIKNVSLKAMNNFMIPMP